MLKRKHSEVNESMDTITQPPSTSRITRSVARATKTFIQPVLLNQPPSITQIQKHSTNQIYRSNQLSFLPRDLFSPTKTRQRIVYSNMPSDLMDENLQSIQAEKLRKEQDLFWMSPNKNTTRKKSQFNLPEPESYVSPTPSTMQTPSKRQQTPELVKFDLCLFTPPPPPQSKRQVTPESVRVMNVPPAPQTGRKSVMKKTINGFVSEMQICSPSRKSGSRSNYRADVERRESDDMVEKEEEEEGMVPAMNLINIFQSCKKQKR